MNKLELSNAYKGMIDAAEHELNKIDEILIDMFKNQYDVVLLNELLKEKENLYTHIQECGRVLHCLERNNNVQGWGPVNGRIFKLLNT